MGVPLFCLIVFNISTHKCVLIIPLQLPTPVWMEKQDEIVAWYEERDLPVAIGGTGFGTVPTHARIARW